MNHKVVSIHFDHYYNPHKLHIVTLFGLYGRPQTPQCSVFVYKNQDISGYFIFKINMSKNID